MNFGQWIGNRHGYCQAHEESQRGDKGGGGGSDHVDVGIVVLLGLEKVRSTQVSLMLVCKSLDLKG